jgi:F-type H+-transporting ATPase subunit epsilon
VPLHLEIVTPERLAFSEDVDAVVCPGVEGELGILPHHAPLLTTLGVGELRIRRGSEEEYFAIAGGFLQVRPDKVVVWLRRPTWPARSISPRRRGASRGRTRSAEGFEEPADLARARASLQRALLHIRVANAAIARARVRAGSSLLGSDRLFHWEYQEPPVERQAFASSAGSPCTAA